MIEILSIGEKIRIKLHFTCEWCGCKFAADEADYSKKYIGRDKEWEDIYEYHTICPICGGHIFAQESEVEKWQYIYYEDGTESVQKVK